MRPLKYDVDWPPIAVYDIEADDWVNVFLVCHVDELGNRLHFTNIDDYLDFLFSDRFKGSHVWAHAGGRYDHQFLIHAVDRRGWDFRAALSGGSIVVLTVKANGKRIQFADSYRIMPNALKAIGKTIGLEKLDVDRSNVQAMTPERQLEYCFRDCDIALKGLQYMRDVLTSVNGDFAFTLASIASRWVRRSPVVDFNRFYRPDGKGSIEYDPAMLEADAWCEPAYFGGRTEMLAHGQFKGPIYYYDVVSSYPWSMTNELPLYLQGFYPPPKSNSISALERYLSYAAITEATVTIPLRPVGPLCVEHNNRLVFPYGRVTGRWTNIELMAALQRGCKIEPHYQCRFESVKFLEPFVRTFYGLRKKAKADNDEFRTYAFKILLNSLYGKLVETIDRRAYTTSKWEIERAKEAGHQVLSTKTVGVYCIASEEEGPFRHVAAGAYVTAYSRLKLLEGLESVFDNGGHAYYCDTDSIMSSIPLPHLEGKELGQWNHEYTIKELELLLPKVYRAVMADDSPNSPGKTIYRCKGVPINREGDDPSTPRLRWEAYKHYAETGDPEMARLLAREGVSGFVQNVNAGSLRPRKIELLRCLRAHDRKRDWSVNPSLPLYLETG